MYQNFWYKVDECHEECIKKRKKFSLKMVTLGGRGGEAMRSGQYAHEGEVLLVEDTLYKSWIWSM